MTDTTDKFILIRGKLPRKAEISDWSQTKMHSLLKFAWISLREVTYRGKTTLAFHYDEKFLEAVNQYDDPFFAEFHARLDNPDASHMGMRGRMISMVRTMLSYVKSNPHVITPEMEAIMKQSDRFSWALTPFESKKSAIGAEIVTVNNEETTDSFRKNDDQNQTNLSLPEIQYNHSLLTMASLLKDMLKGISKSDIKNMDPKDKLKIALLMQANLAKAFNTKKPTSVVFKKLVVNSASKDDLEKALLEYNQEQ